MDKRWYNVDNIGIKLQVWYNKKYGAYKYVLVDKRGDNAGVKIYYCKEYTKTSSGKGYDTVGTGRKIKLFR